MLRSTLLLNSLLSYVTNEETGRKRERRSETGRQTKRDILTHTKKETVWLLFPLFFFRVEFQQRCPLLFIGAIQNATFYLIYIMHQPSSDGLIIARFIPELSLMVFFIKMCYYHRPTDSIE